jgi:hypothetical protein
MTSSSLIQVSSLSYTAVGESQKRVHDSSSDDLTCKKRQCRWKSSEINVIMNILKNSFANESGISVRSKWVVFTNNFNKEANSDKTIEQIYSKVRSLFPESNNSDTSFRELLTRRENSNNQHGVITQATVPNPQSTQITTQASSSSEHQSCSSSLPSTNQIPQTVTAPAPFKPSSSSISPKEKYMETLSYYCFIGFFEGYSLGKKKYVEERKKLLEEGSEKTIPTIYVADVDSSSFKESSINRQGLHLGYSCAIKRFIDADMRKLDFDFLYSPDLEDLSSIDLSCASTAARHALERRNHEIQMNLTEETSEYTPITDLFDSMDFTFKESVNRQIYALFFTHAIHKINKDLEIKEKL